MASKGFIIGKFMPPHNGHLFLFDQALACVDSLTVMVFWKRNEPIPGPTRVKWLKSLRPQIAFLECTDEHPVDFNSAAIWDLWMASIRKIYSETPDFVFASEDYGTELARRLGSKFVLVDKAKKHIQVNASQLRSEPWLHWQHIPAVVRPCFVQRIAIVGGESTGKTTLAGELAARFGTQCVTEYAREFLTASNNVCTPADMPLIAREQVRREELAQESCDRFLFCDTNAVVTKVWSQYYFQSCSEEVKEPIRIRPYSLYLLLRPDLPWKADNLRDSPSQGQWFYEAIKAELVRIGAIFREVGGSGEERTECALRQVEEFFRL